MKNAKRFDPLQSTRRLIEMLYDSGMLHEAVLLCEKTDAAQIHAWREEALKEAQ